METTPSYLLGSICHVCIHPQFDRLTFHDHDNCIGWCPKVLVVASNDLVEQHMVTLNYADPTGETFVELDFGTRCTVTCDDPNSTRQFLSDKFHIHRLEFVKILVDGKAYYTLLENLHPVTGHD
jgi:hypothetical protein